MRSRFSLAALFFVLLLLFTTMPRAWAQTAGTPVVQNDFTASGVINTQNLVGTPGMATAGSAVLVGPMNNAGDMAIQVTGTYTGALTVQLSLDGVNWVTDPSILNVNTGGFSATIPSATPGIYQVGVEGARWAQVTGLSVMTGSAVVTTRVASTDSTVAIDEPLPAGTALLGAVNLSQVGGSVVSSTSISGQSGLVPVGLSDLPLTGQGSQTVLNNNIILQVAGSGATSTLGYRSWSISIVPAPGTVTGGNVIFEGSNDGGNWQAIQVYDQNVPTGLPLSTYALAATTNRFFKGPLQWAFIRARISNTVTGTTTGIQASTLLSQAPFIMDVDQVASATTANFNGTVNMSQYGTAAVVNGGAAGVPSVGGKDSVGGAASTNPVVVGAYVLSTLPSAVIANSSVERISETGDQQLIVHLHGDPSNEWQATSGVTPLATNTSTAAKTAGGAGIRNYVTDIHVVNTSATVSTTFSILDGASVIWTTFLPATTSALVEIPVTIHFETPLKGTAATALNVQCGTTSASVYYNVSGYQNN